MPLLKKNEKNKILTAFSPHIETLSAFLMNGGSPLLVASVAPPLGPQLGHFDDDPATGSGTQTLTRPKARTQKPAMYKVILLNDDFTPMDFVVHILERFFQRTAAESNRIMLQVHNDGAGVAGVYTHEVAETKVYLVNDYAKKQKHPLKCIMEKSEED